MSNRILLRLNTGAPDGSLFMQGIENSYFAPCQWKVISDKIRDIQTNLFTQNIGFGQTLSFTFDKVGTLLEDVKLDLTLSPIVGAGVGTYVRACDYLGLALISNIQLTYQQNTIMTWDPLALYVKNLRDHDITHRTVFDDQLAGKLTHAQRNTRATAVQTTRTYMKPYWYGLACHCPIITALANRIQFKVQFANVSDFVQTDYTNGATVTLQTANVVYEVINTTGKERDQFARLGFTPMGLTYLVEQTHDLLLQKIPAGSTKFAIPMIGFVLPFSTQYFLFQSAADTIVPYQKKLYEPSYQDLGLISKFQISDGSNANFITLYGPRDFADHWQKHHCKSQYRAPVISFCATEISDLKNANLGSFNASNINNFQVYFEFTAPLAQDYYVSIINFEHNWVNHQGGELQTVFN